MGQAAAISRRSYRGHPDTSVPSVLERRFTQPSARRTQEVKSPPPVVPIHVPRRCCNEQTEREAPAIHRMQRRSIMIAHTLFLDAARGSVRAVLNLRILALHASDDPRHGAEGRERRVCPRDKPAARLDTDRPGDCSRHGASDEPAPRLPTDVDATANSRVPIVIRRCLVPVAVAKPESEHSAAGRPTCRLVRGPVRPSSQRWWDGQRWTATASRPQPPGPENSET